jgi:transposase
MLSQWESIMRKPSKIELTDEQRTTLTVWVTAGKTEQRLAKRAQVILYAAAGLSLKDIEGKVGLSFQSCLKWRKRFLELGLKGLRDVPRKGRPAVITPEERVHVMALACTKPDDDSNQWTTTKLADASGLSRTTVHRILNEAALKPHKIDQWCGKSPDPEFEPKQTNILGLYLSPPENALVISVDEKSQIQALDRTQPMLPLRPNNAKRQTHTRHGTTCLLAALLVHQGIIEGRCVDSHTHSEFLGFLKHLYRKYPHKHLHVIVDNYSAHKHQKVMEWASKRKRLTLHFTPTYASWLNQIEIWFSIYTRDVIRGGIWQSKQELVNQTMRYIKRYNETNAAPFNWTYTGKPLVA